MNAEKVLRGVNTVLMILILCVGGYLLVAPVLPELRFLTSQRSSDESVVVQSRSEDLTASFARLPIAGSVNDDAELVPSESVTAPEVDEFSLTIPSIQLDRSVGSSSFDSDDLWDGIWHKKRTGDPFHGGNMVITAHRFLYLGRQDTFYHLPKVAVGDQIFLEWGGEEYGYQVTEVFEVTADQVEIEADTEEHVLTLYTCTPLWTSARRFVVRAEPIINSI